MKTPRNYITDHIGVERGFIYRIRSGQRNKDDQTFLNETPRCPDCEGIIDPKIGDTFGDGGSSTVVCGGCEVTWRIKTTPTIKLVIDV